MDELWENVLQPGKDTHQRIPESRFNIDDYLDRSAEKETPIITESGCFLKNPGEFDNSLFNISPREAMQMDPLQRLFLTTTYEALQNAGYSRDATLSSLQSRIATYLGQSVEDWKPINDQQGVDTHYIPGTMRSFAPGRINHYFKWGGGYYSIDTACSASSTAIHLACSALLNRECDTAVAGGGHLCVTPEFYSGLSQGGFLSPNGPCKTFAEDADGYCRGEAVGVVILKRLEDAVRENDNILSVIRGSVRNSNSGAASITFPSEDAQEALYNQLLRDTGTDPQDVSFVEMHGTATQAGDNAEMNVIKKVFGRGRSAQQPLHVGAIKANVGHSEGAAGVSSLIKAVLMMQKRQLPRQPGWPFQLNPKFADLDESHIRIADGRTPLTASLASNGRLKLVVNSFDAAGGNTSLLLEEPPTTAEKRVDGRSHHVVVCSGRTVKSLNDNERRLLDYLSSHPLTDLASLAYTTTARRMHEVYRSSFVVKSTTELVEKLKAGLIDWQAPPRSFQPQVIFTFTGQGAVKCGMGASLYKTSSQFRQSIDSFQDICDAQHLSRFVDIVNGTGNIDAATPSQIHLSVVALEVALARYWMNLGVQPAMVIGHSLGEYAALCVAGVLSVSDMFYLVHARGDMIQERCTVNEYSMLCVPLSGDESANLMKTEGCDSCTVACYNAASATVISGKTAELKILQRKLGTDHVHSTLLEVPYGFHSRQLEPILDAFEAAATRVNFAPPQLPVASTLLGEIVTSGEIFGPKYLRRQTREPVQFVGAVDSMEAKLNASKLTLALEIGPHPITSTLIQKFAKPDALVALPSLRNGQEDWQTLASSLATLHALGANISWRELHREYESNLTLIDLPAYAFDSKTFWAPYKTRKLHTDLPSEDAAAGAALPWTCLQRVESYTNDAEVDTATFVSNSNEPHLFAAIQGHLVDGISLCPATVFAEMAYSAAIHMLQHAGRQVNLEELQLNNLQMTHGVIVDRADPQQAIKIRASMQKNTNAIMINFSSITNGVSAENGTCEVKFGSDALNVAKAGASRMQKLIRSRAQNLMQYSKHADTHRLSKHLFYKLFGELVEYHEPYQAIEEACISSDFTEAAASMIVKDSTGLGHYSSNPFAVDALVHVSGFMLNANISRAKDEIFISNRIGNLHLFKPLSPGSEYMCYCNVHDKTSNGITLCDVFAFDHSGLVACCTDISFRKTTKEIFAIMTGRPPPVLGAAQRPLQRASDVSTGHSSVSSRSSSGSVTPDEDEGYSTSASSITSADPVHLDVAEALLEVVSKRTGLGMEDLAPSVNFADSGIDSPMGIAILSEFQRTTEVSLPAAFFVNCPTVADARAALASTKTPSKSHTAAAASSARRNKGQKADAKLSQPPKSLTRPKPQPSQVLLQVAADLVGVKLEELATCEDFASAGIDSMMGIRIMAKYTQVSGQQLPASFFVNNPGVQDVQRELDLVATPAAPLGESDVSQAPVQEVSVKIEAGQRAETLLESRAVLVQGDPNSKQLPVFLITDGSGSADAFVRLPKLPEGQRIYALESPFLENPDRYTVSIPELAEVFISAIHSIQGSGPYIIGGRSAGAAYAYEVAHQLAHRHGKTIAGLVLMDMRVPRTVPMAKDLTVEFMEKAFSVVIKQTKSFDQREQRTHALNTVRALYSYDPVPFKPENRPKQTFLMWAEKGVNDGPFEHLRDPTVVGTAEMGPPFLGRKVESITMDDFEADFKSWFWARRETFGGNGWDKLLGDGISIHKVAGGESSAAPPSFGLQLTQVRSLLHGSATIRREYGLGTGGSRYEDQLVIVNMCLLGRILEAFVHSDRSLGA